MEHITTQRILIPHLRNGSAWDAALRWARRMPGMIAARRQTETGEIVVTYDLRTTTLSAIRHHLERGGVACDGSLIQRCHLFIADQRERAERRSLGLGRGHATPMVPLIPARQAA